MVNASGGVVRPWAPAIFRSAFPPSCPPSWGCPGLVGAHLSHSGGHTLETRVTGESGVRSGVPPQMRPQIKDKGCDPGNTVHQNRENEPRTSPGRPQVTPPGGDRTRSLQRGPLQLVPLHVPQCPRAIGTQSRRWRSVGAKCDTGVLTRVMRAIGGKM